MPSLHSRGLNASFLERHGSATVRPYIGAVKGVALPIVPQAINGTDGSYSHRVKALDEGPVRVIDLQKDFGLDHRTAASTIVTCWLLSFFVLRHVLQN
jgi:hypothetical protein